MKILYPPRPKSRILPNELAIYEKSSNWVVQRKFNGTRILLHIAANSVYVINRHGTSPKQFTLTPNLKQQILSLDLDPSLEYWLDGELLDAKTKGVKSKIVLFDVLQAGRYLYRGPDLMARQATLQKICRNSQKHETLGIALEVTADIWLAETFHNQFPLRFNEFLHLDEIEGLVLKKKSSVIDNFGTKEYEVGWQIRCRKPNKSYTF